jgi:hypothetical protein
LPRTSSESRPAESLLLPNLRLATHLLTCTPRRLPLQGVTLRAVARHGVPGQAPSPARQQREKLLRAYYADAIDVATLKGEQARINAEVAQEESQLVSDGGKLAQVKQIINLAVDLATDCAASYQKARPDVRKMWNRAFFRTIRVRDGAVADFTYEERFASLLGSHKGSIVDPRGFEP